jgi:hypothetical protein
VPQITEGIDAIEVLRTELEAKIDPDRVLNNFGGKAIA